MMSNIASSVGILLCLESLFFIKGEVAIKRETCLQILKHDKRARVSAHRHRERQSSQHPVAAMTIARLTSYRLFLQDDSISHECALKALGITSPES